MEDYVAGCIDSAGYQIEEGSPSAGRHGALVLAHGPEHPAHLTVTAEVKGITKVEIWRDALDALQRRHPVLSTSIIGTRTRVRAATANKHAELEQVGE
jgi:hypothetical protein